MAKQFCKLTFDNLKGVLGLGFVVQIPQNPWLPKWNFDLECIYKQILTNKKNPKAPLYIGIEYIDQRVN
jgi:hypothetical protein